MILGVDHLSFEGVEVSDVEKKILQAYFHQKNSMDTANKTNLCTFSEPKEEKT